MNWTNFCSHINSKELNVYSVLHFTFSFHTIRLFCSPISSLFAIIRFISCTWLDFVLYTLQWIRSYLWYCTFIQWIQMETRQKFNFVYTHDFVSITAQTTRETFLFNKIFRTSYNVRSAFAREYSKLFSSFFFIKYFAAWGLPFDESISYRIIYSLRC